MPLIDATEVSNDDILSSYSDRAFPNKRIETGAIPASYTGKYVTCVMVVTDSQLDQAAADNLEAAIELVTNPSVHKAFAVIQRRIPLDRVPADTAQNTYSLHLAAEVGLNIKKTPVV